MSVASVTGSLFSILMGTVSSAIMMIVFPTNYTVLFSVAVVLFFLGTFLLSRYKVINVDKTPTVKMAANPVKALIQLFQQRDCRSMLITHLAKGVFTTATTYIIVVALENLKPDAVFSSYIFITSTVATVLGSTIFGFMNKKFKTRYFLSDWRRYFGSIYGICLFYGKSNILSRFLFYRYAWGTICKYQPSCRLVFKSGFQRSGVYVRRADACYLCR